MIVIYIDNSHSGFSNKLSQLIAKDLRKKTEGNGRERGNNESEKLGSPFTECPPLNHHSY